MRVVSLVPSWTETLLEAGVEVVGRTRFCIHPGDKVSPIPRVGGTKDWQWPRILSLKPDLLLLDREENPKFMVGQSEIPVHATHIQSLHDMPASLRAMSAVMNAPALSEIAARWEHVIQNQVRKSWDQLVDWGARPVGEVDTVLYMIWRDPWMAVSRSTFIGSVLSKTGLTIPEFPQKYPQIDLAQFDPARTLLLFSSEPYPFLRKREEVVRLGFPHAFIDGESFSWFGVRTLRFLESLR